MMRSSSGGTAAFTVDARGGSTWTIAAMVSASVARSYIWRPVTISSRRAEPEEIGTMVNWPGGDLLWTHVTDSPHDNARNRSRGRGRVCCDVCRRYGLFRQSEI